MSNMGTILSMLLRELYTVSLSYCVGHTSSPYAND